MRISRKAAGAAALVALCGALALGGCAGGEAVDVVAGEEADDAPNMVFVNDTGLSVSGLSVAASADGEAAFEELAMDAESWDGEQTARLYAPAGEDAYDVCLTFSDGSEGVLHGVTFSEADEVSVCLDADSGVVYLSYTVDDENVTTLEAELDVLEHTPDLTVGVEGDETLSILAVNASGADIEGVAVRDASDDDAEFEALAVEGDVWAADTKAQIFVEPLEDDDDEGDLVLVDTYDVQLTFADGTECVLHDVTFTEADVVEILLDEESGLAYLSFEVDGSDVTTLEDEIAIQEEEAAAAEAAAEAAAAAEAEAAAAAEAEAEAEAEAAAAEEEESSSSSYSYDTSSGSDSDSSSSSSQEEDSCVDDLVLR